VAVTGKRRRYPQHLVQQASAGSRRWARHLAPKPKPTTA
jgi:hypothetical protein